MCSPKQVREARCEMRDHVTQALTLRPSLVKFSSSNTSEESDELVRVNRVNILSTGIEHTVSPGRMRVPARAPRKNAFNDLYQKYPTSIFGHVTPRISSCRAKKSSAFDEEFRFSQVDRMYSCARGIVLTHVACIKPVLPYYLLRTRKVLQVLSVGILPISKK